MTTKPTDKKQSLRAWRRRVRFRAWHRGTKEADIILGRFVDRKIHGLHAEDLAWLERLMEEPDQDILDWITGKKTPPDHFNTPLMIAMQKLDYVTLGQQTTRRGHH